MSTYLLTLLAWGVVLAESEAQNTLFLFLTTTATDMLCII
jgi:hypothetical protein